MDFSFYGSKYWKSLLKLGLVAYTLLVIWGMLFGLGRTVKESHHYNLVPFSTIIDYLHIWDVHTGASTMNVLGNIGIFVPFGFLIPLVFGGQWKRMLIIHTSGILLLETLQLVSKRGSFDVDDLLLNTLGAFLGFLMLAAMKAKLEEPSRLRNDQIQP